MTDFENTTGHTDAQDQYTSRADGRNDEGEFTQSDTGRTPEDFEGHAGLIPDMLAYAVRSEEWMRRVAGAEYETGEFESVLRFGYGGRPRTVAVTQKLMDIHDQCPFDSESEQPYQLFLAIALQFYRHTKRLIPRAIFERDLAARVEGDPEISADVVQEVRALAERAFDLPESEIIPAFMLPKTAEFLRARHLQPLLETFPDTDGGEETDNILLTVTKIKAALNGITSGAPAKDWPEPVSVATMLTEEEDLPEDYLVEGIAEAGDKVVVVAPSKNRKTFFTLGLAIALAAGLPEYAGLQIAKPRRVLLAQLEVKGKKFRKRMKLIMDSMGLCAHDLGDRLQIINARGCMGSEPLGRMDLIAAQARKMNAELVVLDPLYKVVVGSESDVEVMQPVIAKFDEVIHETGAALLYVAHAAKGNSCDKDVLDLVVGSGALVRDADSIIAIRPHLRSTAENTLSVLSFVLRNDSSPLDYTVAFKDCVFERTSDEPFLKSSENIRNKSLASIKTQREIAREVLEVTEGWPRTPKTEFVKRVVEAMRANGKGYSRDKIRGAVEENITAQRIMLEEERKGVNATQWLTTTARSTWDAPKAPQQMRRAS
jgi:RecA-family ATPase